MAKTNKGKKYISLKGDEVATPENLKRAEAFLIWYSLSLKALKSRLHYRGRAYDHDVCQDTAITIYENIAFKGSQISDIKGYFQVAYQTNKLKAMRDDGGTTELDEETANLMETSALEKEEAVHKLRLDILNFVRLNRPPFDCTIFEIYEGLHPDISMIRLAEMLGIERHLVEYSIKRTTSDIRKKFKKDYDYLRHL